MDELSRSARKRRIWSLCRRRSQHRIWLVAGPPAPCQMPQIGQKPILGVDGGHMPRAGIMAGTAADALVGVHHADALLVGRNGLLGAGVAAGGVFALAAGVREVDPAVVVAGQQAVAGAVQIQAALEEESNWVPSLKVPL